MYRDRPIAERRAARRARGARDRRTSVPREPAMIITRSPLRITLGGGGTDLPSYYQKRGGFLIAGAIDKYVYITIHETFVDDLIVKYSKLERVPCADRLEHPIFREALRLNGIGGETPE